MRKFILYSYSKSLNKYRTGRAHSYNMYCSDERVEDNVTCSMFQNNFTKLHIRF